MNEHHNIGCESSYLFGWMNCEAKCGIENVVFVEDLIGGWFYFWDLLGPFGKIVTFCNKNHLVAMRRLEGHELGPDWKLRTARTGRGEFSTPKTNRSHSLGY